MVNDQTAPALAALMKNGVHFTDTHSMFPTITTVNAASMATGHKVGDTGNIGNWIYVGFLVYVPNPTLVLIHRHPMRLKDEVPQPVDREKANQL